MGDTPETEAPKKRRLLPDFSLDDLVGADEDELTQFQHALYAAGCNHTVSQWLLRQLADNPPQLVTPG